MYCCESLLDLCSGVVVIVRSSWLTLILELCFPNILYLNCLHRTDITYLKHWPNFFPTFNLNFFICVVIESSGSKSLGGSGNLKAKSLRGSGNLKASLCLFQVLLVQDSLSVSQGYLLSMAMCHVSEDALMGKKKKSLDRLTSIVVSLFVLCLTNTKILEIVCILIQVQSRLMLKNLWNSSLWKGIWLCDTTSSCR